MVREPVTETRVTRCGGCEEAGGGAAASLAPSLSSICRARARRRFVRLYLYTGDVRQSTYCPPLQCTCQWRPGAARSPSRMRTVATGPAGRCVDSAGRRAACARARVRPARRGVPRRAGVRPSVSATAGAAARARALHATRSLPTTVQACLVISLGNSGFLLSRNSD